MDLVINVRLLVLQVLLCLLDERHVRPSVSASAYFELGLHHFSHYFLEVVLVHRLDVSDVLFKCLFLPVHGIFPHCQPLYRRLFHPEWNSAEFDYISHLEDSPLRNKIENLLCFLLCHRSGSMISSW